MAKLSEQELIRREKLDRRVTKIINDQNFKYFMFIKNQTKMKQARALGFFVVLQF